MENQEPLNQPLPPFSCSFSPNVPELLRQMNCSLALTTYQAGKVVLLSATDHERLVQLPRDFRSPMGMALRDNLLALATLNEVVVFANSPELAAHFPDKPGVYDAMYLPRTVRHTGELAVHDMGFGPKGLWAVNTRFSCLCLLDDGFSFRPAWKPPFISDLLPEDRCHLNGMAMEDGEPAYVTALAPSDKPGGWREDISAARGLLMRVSDGEVILDGLYMPHSPRLYKGSLYLLNSGTGELLKVDPATRRREVVTRLKGFARGLARWGDFLFIGLSRLRQNSSTFRDLPIAKESLFSGIQVVDLRAGSVVGQIQYHTSVDEIYDVQVLPGMLRPNILGHEAPEHRLALSLPGATFWGAREKKG